MTFLQRVSLQSWFVVLLLAAGVLVWSTGERVKRIEYVSNLARTKGSEPSPSRAVAATSLWHNLIVPERSEATFHLLLQTQQMRDRGQMRVRHADYDNAPDGRRVESTSAYRWWLAGIAWWDRVVLRRPLDDAWERATLWSDPILHGVLLIAGTVLVAWRFGAPAASVFAIGVVGWFPFAASFVPGVPDPRVLARALNVGSILLMATGYWAPTYARRCWIAAGVCGGMGLWVNVPASVPVIGSIGLGGFLAAWILRRQRTDVDSAFPAAEWRAWSISGAVTVLFLCLVEYAPSHLGSWSLDTVHPLYGVAWLGLGELLGFATYSPSRNDQPFTRRRVALLVISLLVIATLPLALHWSGSRGYGATDLSSFRLTQQPGGVLAQNIRDWWSRDGFTLKSAAALAPLAFLIPAGWSLCTRSLSLAARATIAFLLGPVGVALGFAVQQLSWWGLVGATLLVLACVLVASLSDRSKWLAWCCIVGVAGMAAIGFPALGIGRFHGVDLPLTSAEAEELIERDLAQWLSVHSTESRSIVFAPPRQSLSFAYFGGLRGIGTFAPENRSGFGAALTLTGVKSMEEVQGLIESRGIRFVVVPSWDPFFDEFARRYLAQSLADRKSFFVTELRRFNLPSWLRPLSYPMPVLRGFEQQSALIFEVVEPQSPSLAASRLTDYFLEIGDITRASQMVDTLRRFPGDLGALTALAQIFKARADAAGFASAFDAITARLANGADRFLPWERRVSLSVVLAQGARLELARDQTARCISEASEVKLRSLSGDALFGLLVLSDTFQLPMADPKLATLALSLLPGELRQRL